MSSTSSDNAVRSSHSTPRAEVVGLGMVATAAILWGLLGPVARVALAEGVQPLELGFWRAALAGVLCIALTLTRKEGLPIAQSDLAGVIAFGVAGVALFYASYFFAVELAGAALAAILLYTAPAWVAIGAAVWLGESITRHSALAVTLTLLGVAAVSLDANELAAVHPAGILWGLLAGLSYALYYLAGKRYFTRYGTLTVMAYALPVGALALLPFVDFSAKSVPAWWSIAFMAAIPTFAAYLIYGAGLIRVAATKAATVAAIEPLVAAVVAFAFWNERFGIAGYLGGALVLTGVFLSARAPGPGGRRPPVGR